ncbi:MAG: biotin carboxyl carrier protein [Myxococcota bacterium]
MEVELSTMKYEITIAEQDHSVDIERISLDDVRGLSRYRIAIDDGPPVEVESCRPVPDVLSLLLNGGTWEAGLVRTDEGFDVELIGVHHEVTVVDPRRKALRLTGGSSGGAIITKMPGRIVAILVEEGQTVEKGQPVVIVEAMKMENQLKATQEGVVSQILVSVGDLVEAKTVLVELAVD